MYFTLFSILYMFITCIYTFWVQSNLTRTSWVPSQFLPSLTQDTCLHCSSMSGLMKLACLFFYTLHAGQAAKNCSHSP